jgi:hypothetical protein
VKVSSFLLLPLAALACAGPSRAGCFYAVVLPVGRGGATLRPQLLRAHRGDRDGCTRKAAEAGHRFEENKPDVVYPIQMAGMPRPTCEAP